ncbi:hypothetical protein F5Y06DRAFT_306460 [Hypoxylon sp. FL0890]|nr:hypothetical protein F5Y06DRAFT_306460 [Hypoxylon sp. FL0890]
MRFPWDRRYKSKRSTGDADKVVNYFTRQRIKTWKCRLQKYWAQKAGVIVYNKASGQLELCRRVRIGTEFHGFMKLPRELRDMIYSCALVQGSVFLPNYAGPVGGPMDASRLKCLFATKDFYENTYLRYKDIPADWAKGLRTRQPIGLICGVSKKVHEEAIAIYYGRNQFVFPYGKCNIPALCPEGPLQTFERLRDLSFTFDMRHTNFDPCFERHLHDTRPDENDEMNTLPVAPRIFLRRMHRRAMISLEHQWRNRVLFIKQFELDRLQLSFEECYCPMGCCRLAHRVARSLVPHNHLTQWKTRPPRTIEVIGWNNDIEQQNIIRGFKKLRIDDVPIKVRFLGKSKKEVRDELRAARLL